jgi:hypothetical protein
MSELTLIETLFYKHAGMYYLVAGDLLIQYDTDYFLIFPKGNETYGYLQRRLRKIEPISQSEGMRVLGSLRELLNRLIS